MQAKEKGAPVIPAVDLVRRHPPSGKSGARVDLRSQPGPPREECVGIGMGASTFESASNQVDIETRQRRPGEKSHGLVVRAHAAGEPAVAEARRVEERTQIRLAVLGLERGGGRKAA